MRLREQIPGIIVAGFCVLINLGMTANAASPLPLADQVGNWEGRFFIHRYEKDPLPKRIERLEFLVFGSKQSGTDVDRFAKLKTAIAERDRTHNTLALKDTPSSPGSSNSKAPIAQQPAPSEHKNSALDILETQILKKTHPEDSVSDRLANLEKKVFGRANNNFSYTERVDRLQKITGISLPGKDLAINPNHREYGENQMFPFGGTPFGAFAFENSFGDPRITEMFRQLNKQMHEMQKWQNLPPGEYKIDPNGTPVPIQPFRSAPAPLPTPNSKLPGFMPVPDKAPTQDVAPKVPPYYDPNSI